CAVRVHRIGSRTSGGVENKRAPDSHSAEWIGRRTISVELEALHNGFRYEIPTEVLVPVEAPHIQAPQHINAATSRVGCRPRGSGRARYQRYCSSQAHRRTSEGEGAHYRLS